MICRSIESPVKVPATYLWIMTDSKVCMEWEKTQKSPHNIDEDQAGGLTQSDFKTYYEAIVFKNITEK